MENKELKEIRAKIEAKIKAANTAIDKGVLKAYQDAMAELTELEKEYQAEAERVTYNELKVKPNAIIEAIKQFEYRVIRHKEITEKPSGKVSAVRLVEDKMRQIDLLKFCKAARLETDWQYKVERFNQLLTMRAATDLGLTAKEIKDLSKSYYMDEAARKIEMGETPTSNTQVCKMLQCVIDEILPPDDNGKQIYKCNNHDVAYLNQCYTKMGKAKLSVTMAKHDFLRRLIMNVMYRIIMGGVYQVDCKKVKTETTKPAVITTAEKSTKNAEKAA